MLNILKMDIYRMLRTKSTYIIGMILIAMLFFSTMLMSSLEDLSSGTNVAATEQAQATDSGTNIGMNVEVPTEAGARFTVFDVFYANAQGKSLVLLLVIFTVLFTTADISSGYIKNTAGQVRHRWYLIASKAICLAGYTIVMFLLTVGVQAISNRVLFGYLEWGDMATFLSYFLMQLLLHYALVLIVMAIAIIVRSNVFSIILAVCLCMNMMSIFYGLIDYVIGRFADIDFQLLKYTVTGKIGMLPMNPDTNMVVSSAIIAVVFIVASLLTQSIVFEKRDI